MGRESLACETNTHAEAGYRARCVCMHCRDKPKLSIHHRVMAALNFLRYLLIRDKQEDNQVCLGRENK